MFGDSGGLAENSSAVPVGPPYRLDGRGIGGSLALIGGSPKSCGQRPVPIRYRHRWRSDWSDLSHCDVVAVESGGHGDHLTGQDPPAHSPELESPAVRTRPACSAARYSASVMVS